MQHADKRQANYCPSNVVRDERQEDIVVTFCGICGGELSRQQFVETPEAAPKRDPVAEANEQKRQEIVARRLAAQAEREIE